MIYLLRKHDIISVPSYAEGIYHRSQSDIISKIYHPFREERISLKKALLRKCFFLAEKEGLDFAVPVFLFGSAFRFAVKIRPLQLSQLAVSAPGGARWLPPRGRFGFIPLRQQKQKEHVCALSVFGGEEGFFANSVACRAVPPHSRFLRFANPWRQKQSPGLFFLALQIPSTTKTKRARLCSFCFWRRRRDLNPRASCPTYTLSRGASSPLEYFSIW